MQVSVYDTYVRRKDGVTLHLDIIVEKESLSFEEVLRMGENYLDKQGLEGVSATTKECDFCHIEEASEEITDAIYRQGYYILQMEDIPPVCPEQPTRRQLILHIRASDPEK